MYLKKKLASYTNATELNHKCNILKITYMYAKAKYLGILEYEKSMQNAPRAPTIHKAKITLPIRLSYIFMKLQILSL